MKAHLKLIFFVFLGLCFSGCGMNFQALRWQSGYVDDQGRIHYSTLYRAEDPEIYIVDPATGLRSSQKELRSTLDLFLDPGHPDTDSVYVALARVTLNNETISIYSDPDGKRNWDGTDYGRGYQFQTSTGFASCRNAFNNLAVGDYDSLFGEIHWAKKACRDCEPKVVAVTRTKPFRISFEAGPEREYSKFSTLHRLAVLTYPSIAVDDYKSHGIRDISGTDWIMKQATERYFLVSGRPPKPGYSLSGVSVKLSHNDISADKTHDGFYILLLSVNSSGGNKYRKSRHTTETLLVQFTWSAPNKDPIFGIVWVNVNGDIDSAYEPIGP